MNVKFTRTRIRSQDPTRSEVMFLHDQSTITPASVLRAMSVSIDP
ncbi:hypothetical protein L798_04765 [Zootermopsis nevadensis]|uniref:Uncharacterized protein n=1 Tax=Zootermopsis nevadensis TaxID=136037 RepID=A0A067QPF1_ZOONE|nr:hypothetical protein L798_04765 [Zootermopsis nevadensis]